VTEIPQPEDIYRRTLAAGFEIVAGVVASLAFGIGFVFLVVGRGELFTENFLVPIAGLDHRRGSSWLGLAKLWITSPLFNILGGLVMILILTTHRVLPNGRHERSRETPTSSTRTGRWRSS
jgi:formate/nitrite transporter FocA (FNT family)